MLTPPPELQAPSIATDKLLEGPRLHLQLGCELGAPPPWSMRISYDRVGPLSIMLSNVTEF